MKAKVRFVHTSPDAPAVDVAVKGGPVLFSNVAFRQAGQYLSVDAGTYDLEVRLAGTMTVALNVPGVTLGVGKNYSIFAVGLVGNGTLAALPVVDSKVTTGIKETELMTMPEAFTLSQNYPNPFNPETRISFAIRNNSYVKLVVYDMLGKEVMRLVDGKLPAGIHTVTWNGRDASGAPVGTGTYLYTLQTENLTQTRKMLYLR
jgi:hypothetical protein